MKDVIIVGGGLAGLINALLLSGSGLDVLLIEKNTYPHHKVCGEYVSNEVCSFLDSIGADPKVLHPTTIDRFLLSSVSGKTKDIALDLGGFGISRYAFDHFLYKKAHQEGTIFRLKTKVENISFEGDHFNVSLQGGEVLRSKMVIGAYGKRSMLDRNLSRGFILKKSPYIAVKYHLKIDFPDNLIALHNFSGGYCGISKVEGDVHNLCYLSVRGNLKKSKSISGMEEEVLCQNPHLRKIFDEATFLFDKPLVINEVSFAAKSIVENHVLMSGDTCGLITPLCGNGMAMAIRSAKILSSLIIEYFNNGISRKELETAYSKKWHSTFARRLWVGRQTQKLFGSPFSSEIAVGMLKYIPSLADLIVRNTHGKPF